MVLPCFFCQNALSAEINDLGMNYGKELLEKPPVISNEQNNSSQTTVDWEQFLRWKKFLRLTYEIQWKKHGFLTKNWFTFLPLQKSDQKGWPSGKLCGRHHTQDWADYGETGITKQS